MKKTTIVGFAMAALLASCAQPEAPVSQAGVYSMDKVVWNYGGKDNESSAADGNTQFKIYTADSYFYIAEGKDSAISFGVGSYTQTDANNIEEVNIFPSNKSLYFQLTPSVVAGILAARPVPIFQEPDIG